MHLRCRAFSGPAPFSSFPNHKSQRSSSRICSRAGSKVCCQAHADGTSAIASSSNRSDACHSQLSRRGLALSVPLAVLLSAVPASHAASEAPAAEPSTSSSLRPPSSELQAFRDNDYELQIPSNYSYLETPIVVAERGPQPEKSPVLARFEPTEPGLPGSITILERRAQNLKQTLLQVGDISQLGDPITVAKLVLPRGSTLLATQTQIVEQPAKTTPVGAVLEMPPQTYYTYEFTTTTGQHIALAASAKRGTVYLCGATTTAEAWPQVGSVFNRVVKSFRMRSQASIGSL